MLIFNFINILGNNLSSASWQIVCLSMWGQWVYLSISDWTGGLGLIILGNPVADLNEINNSWLREREQHQLCNSLQQKIS